MKRFHILAVSLVFCTALQAQTAKDLILENPHHARAHYSPYPEPTESVLTPAPDGYEAVYLSHYGRHGSRYHTNRSNHTHVYRTLKDAREQQLLTPLGESLYKRVRIMRNDAEGRDGALTELGAEEHRGIAERMYIAFPQIFADDALIESRSTESPRCILSMAANNERLKELNPQLRTRRCAFEGDEEEFLRNDLYQKEHKKNISSLRTEFLKKNLDIEKFVSRIFKDGIRDVLTENELYDFTRQVYALYQICGCTAHTGVELDDIFSPEELQVLWQGQNISNYCQCGNSRQHGKGVTSDAIPLLKDIIKRAEKALKGNGISADLRFGHDVGLAPLIALIDLDGLGATIAKAEEADKVWADFNVMPMAANLQMIFYRNQTEDIIVKFLRNENEARLPIETDMFPYYDWDSVREYFTGLTK